MKKMTMVAVCVALAVALTGCGKSAKDKSESKGREEKETENVGSPKRVAEDFVHALTSDRDARKAERYVDTTQMSSKDIRDMEIFLEKVSSEKLPKGFNFETIRESISVPASGCKLINGMKYTGESAEVLIQFKRDRFKSRFGALIQLVKVDGSWKIDGSQKFGGNGGVWRKVGDLDESDGWDEDSVPAVDVETNKPAAYNSGEDSGGETKIFTLPGGVRMEMVYVAPGSFQMGSENGEDNEKPVHKVTLTEGYWIGKYPVTQAQWNALVSAMEVRFEDGRPVAWFSKKGGGSDVVSGMDTSDFPMESISWDDCQALVDALNKTDREGLRWSLPTEAQWEFAARGGNKSRGYTYSGGNDMDAVGWYYENSGTRRLSDSNWKVEDLESNRCRPHSVKEKDIGNELGIVGMSGNVREWCNDWYSEDYYSRSPAEDPQGPASGFLRVLRGGGWDGNARYCRSAYRGRGSTDGRGHYFGFRLSCSAGPREAGAEQQASGGAGRPEASRAERKPGRRDDASTVLPKDPKHGQEAVLALPGGATMEMIYVAPDSFTMGSPTSEDGHDDEEKQHQVTLTKGFWLGKYEVTQAQWKSVMGENPSRIKGGSRPVECVSWEDCQRFIRKINSKENCEARLPTEAEWEFACRAGSTGPFAGTGNLDDMGWYDDNSGRETHPVGQKRANAWGFYDMHGNVWEWCNDWYDENYYSRSPTEDPQGAASGDGRVLRGGGWGCNARDCRSALRFGDLSGNRINYYGFRLCCSAGPRE